jgi:DNA (cytosine-5)-methyltransferase 1
MAVKTIDEFSGWGGLSKGASYVPDVEPTEGYNHDEDATAAYALNFPKARAVCADITQYPVEQMPHCDLYLVAPACPPFGKASGVPRAFDAQSHNQPSLFEGLAGKGDSRMQAKQEEYRRGRLLMFEPLRYLRAQDQRGTPVLVGVLENVPEARSWHEWDAFIGEFHKLRLKTRLIALRASHVRPVRAPWAPTNRDRLFLAFWHESLGRDPDFDKWLRPNCWCSVCETWVLGVQTFKEPGVDMGAYGEQYLYRCPNHAGQVVPADPETRPALSIIDPTVPGTRLSDRNRPLVDNTILRIANGVSRHWLPLLVPTGGAWRAGKNGKGAQRLDVPMPTLTTRECDGIAVPPLDMPAGLDEFVTPGARIGGAGQALLPFITRHRGGGDKRRAFSAVEPTSTFSAQGNHQGLAMAPDFNDAELAAWARALLVPYYGSAETCHPATEPIGTLTTRDRYGIANVDDFAAWEGEVGRLPDLTRVPMARLRELLDPIRFRMLTKKEAAKAMGYDESMQAASKANKVWMRLIGNSVAVPCGEVIASALVECLTGETLPRDLTWADA